MDRMRRPRWAVIALLALFACSEETDAPNAPPGNPLEGVTLAETSATSLGRVVIDGLPQNRGGAAYRLFLLTTGGGEIEVPLELDAEEPFFWAPVHPEQPNAGGTVRLVVDDGTNRSPELPLDVDPLPAAPGAFASLVTTLREHVEQRATWAGTSFSELQSQSFEAVAPALLPLKIAQSYVDSPEEAHDLTDLVANTDDFLSGELRELVDRLCGFANMEELIRNEIDDFDGRGGRPHGRWADGAIDGTISRGTCINAGPEISTAPELADAMLFSALADLYTDPDGPGGETLSNIGVVMGVVGMLPGAGIPAAIVGVGLGAWQASGQFVGGTYPSVFTDLSFDIDRTEFPEDDPGFAQWSNVKATAASSGWSADASLANIALTALGGVLSATQQGAIAGSETLRDFVINNANLGLGEFLDSHGGVVEFCMEQWTVDITDLPFSTAAALAHRLNVDPATRQVRPAEAGDDILRVAAQPSEFGGREVHEDLAMVVKTIIVDVIPDEILVETPGDVVQVTATIQNADLPTLLWTAGAGSWQDGIGDETNGPATRPLATPTSTSAYPFLITVESLSRQGARADGDPPRLDIATVRYQPNQVVVSPQGECVVNGEDETFSAVVEGTTNQDVTWTLEDPETGFPSTAGMIDVNGVYTAPTSGTGEVLVVATSVENPDARGSALVEYGACVCFWNVSIDGGGSWSGDVATHQFAEQQSVFSMNLAHFDVSEVGMGAVQAVDGPASGELGTYDVVFSFIAGTQAWVAGPNQDDVYATLQITKNTGSEMEGTVSGVAVTQENGEQVNQSFSVRFRSGEMVLGQPFCGDR